MNVAGVFTPKWDETRECSRDVFETVETAIDPSHRYQGTWSDGIVPVRQRLLVLGRADIAGAGAFIETIIPTVEYVTTYPDFDRRYGYLQRGMDFSGVVIFHDLYGNFVGIVRMKDGLSQASCYAPKITPSNIDSVETIVDEVLGEVVLGRLRLSTRIRNPIDVEPIRVIGHITQCRNCHMTFICTCTDDISYEILYGAGTDDYWEIDHTHGGSGGSGGGSTWSGRVHDYIIKTGLEVYLTSDQLELVQFGSQMADDHQGVTNNRIW